MTFPIKGRFFDPFKRGGIRLSFLLSALLVVIATGSANPASLMAGTFVLMLGVALQFWSKGCLHQNREVTQSGPYRFVRHPFYTSCLLIDAGVVVMTGSWPFILIAAAWWTAVYIPAIRAEEAHLRGLFGKEYDRFIARVPMLLPIRRPLPRREHRVDWSGHNVMVTETPRAIRHLTFPLLMLLAAMLASQGWQLFFAPPFTGAWLSTAVAALLLCSLIWRMAFKHGRRLLPMSAMRAENRVLYIALIVLIGLMWDVFDPSTDPLAFRIPGVGLLVLSFLLVGSHRQGNQYAEAALALGLAFLFEFEWFTLLLVPYYLALFVPLRPEPSSDPESAAELAARLPMSTYIMLSVIGLSGVMFTEFWI